MKKIILFILLSVPAFGAWAQGSEPLRINDLSVELSGEEVQLSFSATIADKAVPAGFTTVYAPVITDGTHRVSLPPVVVQGKRAALAWERHEWAAGTQSRYENGIYTENGHTIHYQAEAPYQWWMHDARIDIEVVEAGCNDVSKSLLVLAAPILPSPVVEPVEPVIVPEKTIAERLAETFPFVLPASDFDPNQPIRFYDDERDNALTVFYKINKYDIEPDYADNGHTLVNLLAAIDFIRNSTDSRVDRIVVAGFASPEGPAAFNDRLAWERAVSVKEYILQHTDTPDASVQVFNGSADWRGLRRLVSVDDRVPAQREALQIIDSRSAWDAQGGNDQMARLRSLNNGRTYRYLADHIFPQLRNGTFIRVYFENK